MTELDIALRAVQLYAETHPRPPHVTQSQAAREVDVMTLARISGRADLKMLLAVYYRETAEQIAARL